MYYVVYILKSLKDDKFYVGQTQDLEKRLIRHNRGMVKSTKNRLPLILIYSERFQTRSEAIKREKYFKSLEGGTFIKKYLRGLA